jgi:hypothetical protein
LQNAIAGLTCLLERCPIYFGISRPNFCAHHFAERAKRALPRHPYYREKCYHCFKSPSKVQQVVERHKTVALIVKHHKQQLHEVQKR